MSFAFEFELGAEEHVRASRVLALRRPIIRGMLVASALVALLASGALAAGLLSNVGDPWFLLLLSWCLPVGVLAGILMGPQSQVRQMRLLNRAATGPHVYKLTASGLEMSSVGAVTTLQWQNVIEVFESREFILFYFAKAWAQLLPKRAVPADALPVLRTAIIQWVGARARMMA